MNIHAPLNEYFLVSGVPVVLQISVIIFLFVFNMICAHIINKRLRVLTFGSLFIYLNVIYLSPFFISQTYGLAGFASAHGKSAYDFSLQMFSLYVIQMSVVPIIFLLFYSRIDNKILYRARFRSPEIFLVFVAALVSYIALYFLIVKPGIYYALLGDFQTAKEMRVAAVLGNTSSVANVSRIFDYKNLVVWALQAIILSRYLGCKRLDIAILLFAIFIILSFINFSKGSFVGGMLMWLWCVSYKSKKSSYLPLIILFISAITLLVLYTYYFHSSGITLKNSFAAIFRRLYNNSSSVYLQLNLYHHLIPNYLYIQDWGKVGDLFGLKPEIPKQLVYNEFYQGEGQGGSTFLSEVYLAFGWAGLFFIPLFLYPIVFIDLMLYRFRSSTNSASNWVTGSLIFWGALITIGLQASPFKFFNILTIIRLEYYLFIILVFVMVRIKAIHK